MKRRQNIHECVVLGVAERAVPLAVQQADAAAIEDVEHLRVGACARSRRRRRGQAGLQRDRRQRRARRRTASSNLSRRAEGVDLRPGQEMRRMMQRTAVVEDDHGPFWPSK